MAGFWETLEELQLDEETKQKILNARNEEETEDRLRRRLDRVEESIEALTKKVEGITKTVYDLDEDEAGGIMADACKVRGW